MTLNQNLIVTVVLVLLATSLLISSLDYSSNVIISGGGPDGAYSFVGAPAAPVNNSSVGAGAGSNEHPAEKNGGDAGDPWLGLFGRAPGNDDSIADLMDSGGSLLVIALIAVIIAAISVVAFIIVRRRMRRNAVHVVAPPADATLPEPAPEVYEGLFRLRFPSIREPFPITWGVGEPLDMEIVCKGEGIAEALLSIDGGEARVVRLENGRVIVPLALEKGRHRIMVSPAGAARSGDESWVGVRIIDYREEIVGIFNAMCRRFRPVAGEAGDELTPRELERFMGATMPEAKQRLLDSAVTTFEKANYSLHDMHRADYEIMFISERGIS